MVRFPVWSKLWFRGFVAFFASVLSFYILIEQVPAFFEGAYAAKGARAERSYFYSAALSPITPQEVILVKKSGEDLSNLAQTALIQTSSAEGGAVLAKPGEVLSTTPPFWYENGGLTGPSPFVVPASLQPNVEFWKRIFAVYGRNQAVMHHRDHLELVYSVLDFDGLSDPDLSLSDAERRRLRYALIAVERALILRELRSVQARTGALPEAEKEILGTPLLLRVQTGIREKFASAVAVSGQYMPYMEDIFRSAGVPVEITRLPFIESSFDVEATSSVGAAGIWQFMESTGKTYLRVDADIDERRDPLLATYAAAQFLKHTYDALESWPLVINAYNAGHGRLLQAIKALGTRDIARIITEFKHPDYQFASRNFYPEFLAALEVYRRKDVFFAEVKPRVPLRYDTVSFERPVSVPLIAQYAGISPETLRELNPSFSERLLQGARALTPGLSLKVPYLSGDRVAMVAGRLNRLRGIAFNAGLLETGDLAPTAISSSELEKQLP